MSKVEVVQAEKPSFSYLLTKPSSKRADMIRAPRRLHGQEKLPSLSGISLTCAAPFI